MTLCLNMIVKDESHIIEETLENIFDSHFHTDTLNDILPVKP